VATAVDDGAERLAAGRAVAARVNAAGVPAGAPVPTVDGELAVDVDGTALAERGSPGRRFGPYRGPMELEFSGEVWYWGGPAPWYFVTMPEPQGRLVAEASPEVSYGWGVIPVTARIGSTVWTTSLFPKDGRYLVPLRADVRRAEGVDEGDTVTVRVTIDV